MSLIKRTVVSQIEVTASGTIFLKEIKQIVEVDGDNETVLSQTPHRTPFEPWQDKNCLPDAVKPYADLAWTPEVIAAAGAKRQADALA